MLDDELSFGTIDSWVMYNLTNKREHKIDVTNASRSFMMNINQCQWDSDIFGSKFGLKDSILPTIQPSFSKFGHVSAIPEIEGVPITGVLGDQQAAAFGLGVFNEGDLKCTYGTGCFMIVNTGEKVNTNTDG